jgi:hypothetical protein
VLTRNFTPTWAMVFGIIAGLLTWSSFNRAHGPIIGRG